MHGYKYALIGVAAFGILGLFLTLLLLPHVKPMKSTKTPSLEEGGVPASEQEDNMTETDIIVSQQLPQQKQELDETHQKQEVGKSRSGDKDELHSPAIIQEEAMTVAKVQFA